MTNLLKGIAFAVFATLSWALNFIAPYLTGAYSVYDFLALRFFLAGALGVVFVLIYRARRKELQPGQQLLAAGLGLIGYLGYSACIMGGVVFAGPVLTPAFIGLVPVLLALLGNARDKTLPWSRLVVPLGLLTGGLLLTNLSGVTQPGISGTSLLIGLVFSVAAVALWLIFSLLNQRALERVSTEATGAWTGLMMIGSGAGALLLLPLGMALNVFNFPSLGFGWASAGHLYAWALLIATLSSVVGAWAWNVASRHLPMVLSGQLISLESLFATILGLIFHARLPTFYESVGLAAVLTGAVMAVRVILAPRTTMNVSLRSTDL